MNKINLAVVALAGIFSATNASATVITALPGGTAVSIATSNQFSGGPIAFGSGITFSSTTTNSVFGYTNGYHFASNGSWTGTPAMIGLNTAAGAFTLKFATAISGFLADVNWSNTAAGASMTAYDAAGNVLDTLVLSNTSGNSFSNAVSIGFHGFQQSAATISSIRFSNDYIGIRSISTTTAVAAVPEPATWALMLAGFGIMGVAMRRQVRRSNVKFETKIKNAYAAIDA